MKSYTVQTTSQVTQDQIDDVLADAFEHGISYWCDAIEVFDDTMQDDEYKYISEALTRECSLRLHDREEDRWVYLSITSLVEALGGLQFNIDDYDAADADALVQKAVFGEVIYG